jgi:hypothetical protein
LPQKARLVRATVTCPGQAATADAKQDGCRVKITLAQPVTIKQGEAFEVKIEFGAA